MRFEYELSCLKSDERSIIVATGIRFTLYLNHNNTFNKLCELGDAVIRDIKADNLKCSKIYSGHTGWIYDMQFDAEKIVSAADDKTIKVKTTDSNFFKKS